ncbi:MAG: ATP-binding protein, partial [Bacteroidota bacterium]|nr:ATP-binding protein [Bacteroidota bacterium]
LQLLQERLKKVDINGKNDKITWERNDEVGDLIKTYNSMIEKIEESSYLLKQQERNSSWRELASQVAHDINNPLTPMKLSIQYLQKVLHEKPDLFAQKFQKLAPSFISQIDTIGNIASELNNYSKPTPNKKEKTDISQCIQNAIDLFANTNDISIEFQPPLQSIYVMGEKSLFTRIFNNMIKNSFQAIRDKEEGKITIKVSTSSSLCIVSITDNGCGIKQEDRDKVFNPHFTTKQEGNGIGLTIVKTIIESYDGEINFFSKENEGTTFNITFHRVE